MQIQFVKKETGRNWSTCLCHFQCNSHRLILRKKMERGHNILTSKMYKRSRIPQKEMNTSRKVYRNCIPWTCSSYNGLKRKSEGNIPHKVNPDIDHRIKPCVINKFKFWHSPSCRHPIQKPDVCPKVHVYKSGYGCPRVCWASSYPFQIPFWEVNSIINRLKP